MQPTWSGSARSLVDLGARLRGVSDDVPFVPDARTLKRTQILTLDTPLGAIDLLVDPDGADRYEAMRERADVVDLDGIEFRIASLDDLLSMKRAAGRPKMSPTSTRCSRRSASGARMSGTARPTPRGGRRRPRPPRAGRPR